MKELLGMSRYVIALEVVLISGERHACLYAFKVGNEGEEFSVPESSTQEEALEHSVVAECRFGARPNDLFQRGNHCDGFV